MQADGDIPLICANRNTFCFIPKSSNALECCGQHDIYFDFIIRYVEFRIIYHAGTLYTSPYAFITPIIIIFLSLRVIFLNSPYATVMCIDINIYVDFC